MRCVSLPGHWRHAFPGVLVPALPTRNCRWPRLLPPGLKPSACMPGTTRTRCLVHAPCPSTRPVPTSSKTPTRPQPCSIWSAPATSTAASRTPPWRCWKSAWPRSKAALAPSVRPAAWPPCTWPSRTSSVPATISSPRLRSTAAPSACWRKPCRASASRPRS